MVEDADGKTHCELIDGAARWHEKSTLATFEIGFVQVWRVSIVWHPCPRLTETVDIEPSVTRDVTFAR